MSQEIGLTLDERIRRELPPLGGALRIDAFLAIMTKERARRVASSAKTARADEPSTLRRQLREPEPHLAEPVPDPAPAGSEAPAPDLADSRKIRAEVDAFLHRDDRKDATDNEVADYLDFMGPTGFNPNELPE
jgi:hypothetical protein